MLEKQKKKLEALRLESEMELLQTALLFHWHGFCTPWTFFGVLGVC